MDNNEPFLIPIQSRHNNENQKEIVNMTQEPIQVVHIPVDQLDPFKDHPFKLYEGDRMKELVDNIRDNGVQTPILVRAKKDGRYEILAGHNRVEASRLVPNDAVPAIVYQDLSDEEAQIKVVSSNFHQRSMSEMKPSELGKSLNMLNEAMKKRPGERTDLKEDETGSQGENRSKTMHVIGEMHGLAQATIARYIRVASLTEKLQELLDGDSIKMGAAVHLSYLRTKEQEIIEKLLENGIKIDVGQAEVLKKKSSKLEDGELKEEEIRGILESKKKPEKTAKIKFNGEFLSQFSDSFGADTDQQEVNDVITKALEAYFSKKE